VTSAVRSWEEAIVMGYVAITPARNEEAFIDKTIASMISQSVMPVKWVIVDDGSTDRTNKIVESYANQHKWINVVVMPQGRKRDFAAKVKCFYAGFNKVRGVDFDIIANVDADISFDRDHFEFLLSKFAQNEKLGVAGSRCIDQHGRSYNYKYTSIEDVSGQCQLFRRNCFEEIGGYLPIKTGAEDVIATSTARMLNWETRTFEEKSHVHHRRSGTGSGSALKASFRLGERDFCKGNHLIWEMGRVGYQMMKRPFLIHGALLLLGYSLAAIRVSEKPISKELDRFIKWEQRERMKKILKSYCKPIRRGKVD
jgi:poly-beta-1,6-N-acetyl-D-glucosamine synthase